MYRRLGFHILGSVVFRDDGVAYNEYFLAGCCITDSVHRELFFLIRLN